MSFGLLGEFVVSSDSLKGKKKNEVFPSNMIKFYFLTFWKFLIIKPIPKSFISLQSCSLFNFHKFSHFSFDFLFNISRKVFI